MAGGAGTGKSYLLNQLDLGSLHQVNPDKYVEDPNSPAYNKLSPGVALANKEAEALSDEKTIFVWDTTASNPDKIQMFLKKNFSRFNSHQISINIAILLTKHSNFEGKKYSN